jgi:hypothetical protein
VQVTILDAGGLYVTSRTQSPFAPEAVKLAPGSYALDVVIDEAQAQRRAVALASEPVELAVP